MRILTLVPFPTAAPPLAYVVPIRWTWVFKMSRNGRFRLAAIDCPELPTPEGRRARDFVYKRLLRAKTIVVKTQRTDLHGRYVTHLFYTPDEVDIPMCFAQGTHLNEELLKESHAVLAV